MYQYSIVPDGTRTYGIKNLELCDNNLSTPLADMNGDEIEEFRNKLILNMERVVVYTSDIPVKKYDRYVIFFRKAHLILAECVKLSAEAIRGATDEEIKKIIEIAAAFQIKVLFEVKTDDMKNLDFARYMRLRSEGTGLIYDPTELTKVHQRGCMVDLVYKQKIKDDIYILRICDMLYDTLKYVPLLHGNSEIKECASTLLARSFRGYFSFRKYDENIAVEDVMAAFLQTLTEM